MSSTTGNKRLSRIRRRASPQLVAALEAGQISLRMADRLFYLPTDQQRVELQRRVDAAEQRVRRSNVAAATIRSYLNSTKEIDLAELRHNIEAALNSPASV